MHARLCVPLALIFIILWLESKGGNIRTSLSDGVSWLSEKQANQANTLLVIIDVNAEASKCWRTLSLIASVRSRGWTGQVALITDQSQWSFGSAEQDAVYLDPAKTIIRIVDAGDAPYSKSHKYTVFEYFLGYEYFWYIDSDQIMIRNVHHFFKLIASWHVLLPSYLVFRTSLWQVNKRALCMHRGLDLPIKTNAEGVRALKVLNGRNSLESEQTPIHKKARWKYHHNITESNVILTYVKKDIPPISTPIFSGPAYMVVTREFVKQVFINAEAVKLRQQCE